MFVVAGVFMRGSVAVRYVAPSITTDPRVVMLRVAVIGVVVAPMILLRVFVC